MALNAFLIFLLLFLNTIHTSHGLSGISAAAASGAMSVLKGGKGVVQPRELESFETFAMWMMAGMAIGLGLSGGMYLLVSFILRWRMRKQGDIEEARQERLVTHFQEDKLKCKLGNYTP